MYYKFREILPLRPDILVLGMTPNYTIRKPELANPPVGTSPLVMFRGAEEAEPRLGFFDLRIRALIRKADRTASTRS